MTADPYYHDRLEAAKSDFRAEQLRQMERRAQEDRRRQLERLSEQERLDKLRRESPWRQFYRDPWPLRSAYDQTAFEAFLKEVFRHPGRPAERPPTFGAPISDEEFLRRCGIKWP